jgi:hypothetical protein
VFSFDLLPRGAVRYPRLALLGLVATIGCTRDDDIRGESERSPDGGTYLIIADDNGGQCGPMLVDGAVWPHRIDEPGPVRPGPHVIACGTEMSVQVDSGHTYRFDYWGP